MPSEREQLFEAFYYDRILAHEELFSHRHPNKTPEFHLEIIEDFHSRETKICTIGFRESAKSTRAEEGIVIAGAFEEFNHCLVVGSNVDLAEARVHAIRRAYENNKRLIQVFGNLVGKPWADGFLELANGRQIQAMGRGQSIRGTKAEDFRPDLILLDDFEDPESVKTPEGREKTENWLFTELLPAGDTPNLRIRMLSNDRHPECVANKLAKTGSGWLVRRYPWMYKDLETGEWVATWPDRFPVELCEQRKREYYALGRGSDYEQEYMCSSTAPADKPFKKDMFRIEPKVRTWQPINLVFDPARSIKTSSSNTGFVAGGWEKNRLVIWSSWGRMLLPNQIVDAVMDETVKWNPVVVGFEATGLIEWATQPLRREMERRRIMVPLRDLKPPKGKIDFIRGTQPWFTAREVVFVGEQPDLQAQLLSFPSGRMDVPNALAYLILMRPGALIYEDFAQEHIVDELKPQYGRPVYLALNADHRHVAAMLVQVIDGHVAILADWLREGPPDAVLPDIVSEANLAGGRAVDAITPPRHHELYANIGLGAAARRVQLAIRRGAPEAHGAAELRAALCRTGKHGMVVQVSSAARWTLNALLAGYCKSVSKTGMVQDFADDGPYKLLIEGLESLLGMTRLQGDGGSDEGKNMAYTKDGRSYISARVQRR